MRTRGSALDALETGGGSSSAWTGVSAADAKIGNMCQLAKHVDNINNECYVPTLCTRHVAGLQEPHCSTKGYQGRSGYTMKAA